MRLIPFSIQGTIFPACFPGRKQIPSDDVFPTVLWIFQDAFHALLIRPLELEHQHIVRAPYVDGLARFLPEVNIPAPVCRPVATARKRYPGPVCCRGRGAIRRTREGARKIRFSSCSSADFVHHALLSRESCRDVKFTFLLFFAHFTRRGSVSRQKVHLGACQLPLSHTHTHTITHSISLSCWSAQTLQSLHTSMQFVHARPAIVIKKLQSKSTRGVSRSAAH